ncbi:MAG TPA: helicase-related protein [Candidatus Saccharimonadales bacterium]|nr:helicase-related protein [Candidatus Saccharimonadales bacterium]
MSSDVEGAPEQTPGYVDEVEALLKTDFFYDPLRAEALYTNFQSLDPDELGARRNIYIGTLRVLATARRDDREQALRGREYFNTPLWNRQWQLTPKRIGAIAFKHRDAVTPLSRHLAMINAAEQSLEEGYAQEGLWDHQIPYLQGIVRGLQRPAEKVTLPKWWTGDEQFYLQGTTVTGPTGIGKTAVMARTAAALGIGQPLPSYDGETPSTSPARLVIIAPSQATIGQLLGKVGKDTFRTLAPDISFGGYYAMEKTDDADATVISIPKFVSDFRDGTLNGKPVDAIFIDEDHHLTEEQFLTALLQNWRGPVIGFSGTPAYNANKDVRHILRNEVFHGEVLDYTGDVLSDLQLFSFLVHPEDVGVGDELKKLSPERKRELRQEAVTQSVKEFLVPLLREGRRGIVFCEPGDESAHAKQMAEALQTIKRADGKYAVAEAIGSFQGGGSSPENEKTIRKLGTGDIDIITTTVMGQEGLDIPEVNFVVIACKTTSGLKLLQIIGRGTRPSDRFDTTILAQFNTFGFGQHQYYGQTLAGLLTDGTIRQGGVVSRKRNASGKRPGKHAVPVEQFSTDIQTMLERINNRNVAETYTGMRKDVISINPSYISLDTILEGVNLSPHHARYQLLRAGYRFEGRMEEIGGQRIFVRYYEPAAATYFTNSPQPPKEGLQIRRLRGMAKSDETYSLDEIAAALHLNKKVALRYMTNEEKEQGPEARRSDNTRGRSWTLEDGEKIITRLENLLTFPAHLITIAATSKLLNVQYNTLRELVIRLRGELGLQDVVRGNRTFPGIPWASLATLQERYGLREGAPIINYDALPTGRENDGKDMIQYARYVQEKLMPKNWLPAKNARKARPQRKD